MDHQMLDDFPWAMHFGLYASTPDGRPSFMGHDDPNREAVFTGALPSPFSACPLFVSGSWRCWGEHDQDTDGDESLHVMVYLRDPDVDRLDLLRAAVIGTVAFAGEWLDWGTVTSSRDWSQTHAHWIYDRGMTRLTKHVDGRVF